MARNLKIPCHSYPLFLARQGKARQGKARQGKARQSKARKLKVPWYATGRDPGQENRLGKEKERKEEKEDLATALAKASMVFYYTSRPTRVLRPKAQPDPDEDWNAPVPKRGGGGGGAGAGAAAAAGAGGGKPKPKPKQATIMRADDDDDAAADMEEAGPPIEITMYMGKDKYENELLIKYGHPEDVWFHVDNLSSAHVYLRLPRGTAARRIFRETGRLDHLPEALDDCLQLVKANSIEGSKASKVDIVYTPWENLRKGADMAAGQVGYHDTKAVTKVRNVVRDREIVNRLNKTMREEETPDLAAEREKRDREVLAKKKQQARVLKQKEKEAAEKAREDAFARDYARLRVEEEMTSNHDLPRSEDTSAAVAYEEDFM